MDEETKQKYINILIEHLYSKDEAIKIVNDPKFSEEKFNSENYQLSLSNHKERIEKQRKPQPMVRKFTFNPEDVKRHSIERQTALNNAVDHSTPEKSTKDILIEAEEFYNWISKEV